jgi:hypothetical protein
MFADNCIDGNEDDGHSNDIEVVAMEWRSRSRRRCMYHRDEDGDPYEGPRRVS